ncbi:MAG: twin-arginine translocase TatA/TatE family subunit [Clostridiales bacterium]|nr:twin-arginine translocase TatA/TatE family subunit [Clostridiales bacterium]
MTLSLIICLIAGYQWLIIFLCILLLFGGKKIPELMKGVGKGVKAFKDGMNEAENTVKEAMNDKPAEKKAAEATTEKK